MSFVMHGEDSFNERFGFRAQGEFRCRAWYEPPATAVCGVIAAAGAIGIIPNMVNIARGTYNLLTPWIILAVWLALSWTALCLLQIGRAYRYTADEKEFRVFEPDGHEEIFYYADVTSVEYKPLKNIFGRQIGWRVTITSRYSKKKYSLIYEKNRVRRETNNTPFGIIEQRMIPKE